jgi:hypothetical protein
MVLTHTGTLYFDFAAISKTNPTILLSPDCEPPAGGQRRSGTGHSGGGWRRFSTQLKHKLKGKSARKAGAAEAAYQGAGSEAFFRSEAIILTGPATISSRKYNIQYSQGYMEYNEWIQEVAEGPLTAADVAGKHVLDPFTYKLKVQRPRKY